MGNQGGDGGAEGQVGAGAPTRVGQAGIRVVAGWPLFDELRVRIKIK